jgi:hypothetical protein
MTPVVSVVKARSETILSDYKRVMELASWQSHLTGARELLLKLNDIFPEGIEIPAMYAGRDILHLPTVNLLCPFNKSGGLKCNLSRKPAYCAGGVLRNRRIFGLLDPVQDAVAAPGGEFVGRN